MFHETFMNFVIFIRKQPFPERRNVIYLCYLDSSIHVKLFWSMLAVISVVTKQRLVSLIFIFLHCLTYLFSGLRCWECHPKPTKKCGERILKEVLGEVEGKPYWSDGKLVSLVELLNPSDKNFWSPLRWYTTWFSFLISQFSSSPLCYP